jgi:site-specific DNA recombinase
VAELEECGVRVRSLNEEFDTGTASGRLMLTLLSGFAAHEREVIRERSVAGTLRAAEAGAWLGGIVPYGYRKEGERGHTHLVLAETPIAGLHLSEAEVIRLIFQMAAVEKASCQKISGHLNALNVPCAYTRDGRQILRGKRKVNTAGLWRPSRVRNLLISTTYIGQHQFGKRGGRLIVTRTVPAIVEEQIWKQAQETLAANRLFVSPRGNRQYLLRGLIKCGLCGLNYSGQASQRDAGNEEVFYICNGKQAARGLYGKQGRRCPARSVGGRHLEQMIWNDITHFLSHPSEVIDRLQKELR